MVRPIISPYSQKLDGDLTNFICEKGDIQDWIRNEGVKNDIEKFTKLYVVKLKEKIIALSAVYCSQLRLKSIKYKRDYSVPALCIGQLAVLPEYQKKGIGSELIDHAIRLAQTISEFSACRIVYLFSYSDTTDYYKVKRFYETKHISQDKKRIALFFDLLETEKVLT